MSRNIRGQAGTEYVVIIAMSLLLFLILAAIAFDQFQNLSKTQVRNKAKATLQEVADAINEVYLQGAGARKSILIAFPAEVEEGSFKIVNNTVTARVYGSDFPIKVDVPVTAVIPYTGTYYLEIVSEGASVTVGIPDYTITPTFISYSFCESVNAQSLDKTLNLTSNKNSTLTVNLNTSWIHSPNVNLTLSNYSITLAPYNSTIVTVTAAAAPNVTGTFSGQVITNSTNYTEAVPVTVWITPCAGPGNVSFVTISTFADAGHTTPADTFTSANITTPLKPPYDARCWVTGAPTTNCTANVNSSDNVVETLSSIRDIVNGYVEGNWSFTIPVWATILNVTTAIEWQGKDPALGVNVSFWNATAGSWQDAGYPPQMVIDKNAEQNNTFDLTAYYQNVSLLNTAALRFVISSNITGGNDALIDFVAIRVAYQRLDTVYYEIKTYDANGYLVDSSLNIKILNTTAVIKSETNTSTSGGKYSSSYTLPYGSDYGTWLIRVLAQNVREDKAFFVTSG